MRPVGIIVDQNARVWIIAQMLEGGQRSRAPTTVLPPLPYFR